MTLKNLFADDDAVSPVIGVILMVAITVILAAVIGTFVMGLGQDATQQQASAGVSVDGDDVTLNSLGPGTQEIKCPDDDESTSQIGETIDCTDSDSVVAVGEEGYTDAAVYTFN